MTDRTRDSDDHAPVIRLFSSAAVLARDGCPTHRRTRADHALRRDPALRPPPLADSPLVLLDAVLDLVEHRGLTVADACSRLPAPGRRSTDVMGELVVPPHGGLLTWVRHAARAYLGGLAGDGARDGLVRVPVPDFWVRQYMPDRGSSHSRPYEVCARGRGYAYRDGEHRVRELRVPVLGPAGDRRLADAEVAVAAYVLATGAGVDRDVYASRPGRYRNGVPYPMRGRHGGPAADREPPDRVRVVQGSCLDSSTAVLYDATAAEAGEFFDAAGREGLRSALVGGARSPGPDCLSCGVRSGCGRLPAAPGLLGVHDRSRPRRSWSVAEGLRFRGCPARNHFHSLGLPGDPPENSVSGEPAASHRDGAVRAWLRRLHGRQPRRACGPEDLPGDRGSWSAGGRTLSGGEARRGAAMIAAHIGVCPLGGLRSGGHVRVGRTVAADDTRADVLVLARPDLLHHRGGSWCYRDVRTATADLPSDEHGLMDREPALALAVLLFASGALPLEAGSAVELEVLTPDGAHVRSIDPGADGVRAGARQVVHALAEPWHRDLRHPPTPGGVCRDCPYLRWCPATVGGASRERGPEERARGPAPPGR
ncbi:PD-(D/E)XK nuclease family protein [Nocardiopsis sp. NPDC058631]|uniref:PD-(D/E)XK nuclease family protein n=1 Tax=Nocardiopsis sp. NPDC058631 TaxID=3346566 RepID=UPI00365BA283